MKFFIHLFIIPGTIPTEIGRLSSLSSMSLFINSLTGTIPTEIGRLSSLRTMYVYSNRLTGTIPTEIGHLSSLLLTFLDRNSLDGTMPTEVCSLRDTNGGVLRDLRADCVSEVTCSCCTFCR